MRQDPIMEITMTDADSNSDEGSRGPSTERRLLKCGKLRMADSIVVHSHVAA